MSATTYPTARVAAADEAYRLASYQLDAALRGANDDYYVKLWRRQARELDERRREAEEDGHAYNASCFESEAAELRELAVDRVDERVGDERAALEAATTELLAASLEVAK